MARLLEPFHRRRNVLREGPGQRRPAARPVPEASIAVTTVPPLVKFGDGSDHRVRKLSAGGAADRTAATGDPSLLIDDGIAFNKSGGMWPDARSRNFNRSQRSGWIIDLLFGPVQLNEDDQGRITAAASHRFDSQLGRSAPVERAGDENDGRILKSNGRHRERVCKPAPNRLPLVSGPNDDALLGSRNIRNVSASSGPEVDLRGSHRIRVASRTGARSSISHGLTVRARPTRHGSDEQRHRDTHRSVARIEFSHTPSLVCHYGRALVVGFDAP